MIPRLVAVECGNDMASDQITVLSEWSVKQRLVARLRAIGYTQQSSADQVGVDLTTVQRWEDIDAYVAYEQELHQAAWERIEPGIMANVALAVEVQRDMLLGLVPANDKRYLEARRLIDRIVNRLLYVEPQQPTPPAQPAAPSSTVNVSIGGPTGAA